MLKEIFALLDWFRVAILLRFKKSKALFKEGEIWWCHVGMNIGVEIYGKGPKFMRPVLVLRKFSADGFFGVPLTSRCRNSDWYARITSTNVGGSAVLNQTRTFDAKRLIARMGVLSDENFCSVKKSFLELCEKSYKP
jgi:mRNA interferase MazF